MSSMSRGICQAAIVVSKTVNPTASRADMATERRTPSSSLAPNRCPVTTENPDVRPIVRPSRAMNNGPDAPTAARAWTPMVRPTMMMSAIL